MYSIKYIALILSNKHTLYLEKFNIVCLSFILYSIYLYTNLFGLLTTIYIRNCKLIPSQIRYVICDENYKLHSKDEDNVRQN